MSGEIWDFLVKIFVIPLHLVTSSSGLVTNLLNMVIMSRLGLSSSMNVEIFSLAFTDFFATAVELVMYSCCLLSYIHPDYYIDLWSVGTVTVGWVQDPAYFISNWIITLISVERCVSVVFPFHVKSIFTRTRSICVIAVFCCAFIVFVSPLYATEILSWVTVPRDEEGLNVSDPPRAILTAQFTDKSDAAIFLIDVVCTISLTLVSQTALFVCTVTMICSLKSSSRIRQSNETRLTSVSALSSKERRLAKVAITLAMILTGCYIPRYVNIIVYYTIPDMFDDPKFDNFAWKFTSLCISINFSSNFFVYLRLNAKFRQCFRRIFSVGKWLSEK